MANEIHVSKVGTYHPAPQKGDKLLLQIIKGNAALLEVFPDAAAWTIHDSRGTLDGGSACDECGKCDCAACEAPDCNSGVSMCQCEHADDGFDCIGLSFSFVCLDGGENLCEECAAKAGITIIDCDCA